MSKLNDLLNFRLKSKDSKMSSLAELSKSGNLSSFSGIFRMAPLGESEKNGLINLLKKYQNEGEDSLNEDLQELSIITSEVKAITNQAVILHGERIKKAQTILKKYQDGAFTEWLMATYGNRQTPYNFLQYYDFYLSMPEQLQPKIELMPRQAVYTLASRSGENEKKIEIIQNYKGESKQELLSLIRNLFPLENSDMRQPNISSQVIMLLKKAQKLMNHRRFRPSELQSEEIKEVISSMLSPND